LGLFSTGTEKVDNPVFSGTGPVTGAGKGDRTGLIFEHLKDVNFRERFHTILSGREIDKNRIV